MCVCVCMRACVRACVRVCVSVCLSVCLQSYVCSKVSEQFGSDISLKQTHTKSNTLITANTPTPTPPHRHPTTPPPHHTPGSICFHRRKKQKEKQGSTTKAGRANHRGTNVGHRLLLQSQRSPPKTGCPDSSVVASLTNECRSIFLSVFLHQSG